jgi:hypothetical protein
MKAATKAYFADVVTVYYWQEKMLAMPCGKLIWIDEPGGLPASQRRTL